MKKILMLLILVLVVAGCDKESLNFLKEAREQYPDAVIELVDTDGDGVKETVMIDQDGDGEWDAELTKAGSTIRAAEDVEEEIAAAVESGSGLLEIFIPGAALFAGYIAKWLRDKKPLQRGVVAGQRFYDLVFRIENARKKLPEGADEVLLEELKKVPSGTRDAVDELTADM
jgi:hypothetical protein